MFEKLGLKKIQYDVPEFHQAFIHKSFDSKHNNERLEFLGDAILETVISELLFKKFDSANEGLLTRMRSTLVSTENLNLVCREYELQKDLKMSKGTLNLPDAHKDKIYAGLVEAVIGSIFVIEGYQKSKQLIEKLFIAQLNGLEIKDSFKDAKTFLQEYCQSKSLPLPEYQCDFHEDDQSFNCAVTFNGMDYFSNQKSKKLGEQDLASQIIANLNLS